MMCHKSALLKSTFLFLHLAVFTAMVGWQAANSQTCEETPERHALRITGEAFSEAGTGPNGVELTAGQRFVKSFGDGWTFALVPHEYGWSLRIYDNGDFDQAVDLSSVTPPHGGVPNPRDVFGWHFRNANNTGPNTGDVNAPQTLRNFFFALDPDKRGGYEPSSAPSEPRLSEPNPNEGVGWLKILEHKLSEPKPGQKAHFTSLKFEACLTWPKNTHQTSLRFLSEDIEQLGSCGLDLELYELDAAFSPRMLGGDFDGDDSFDQVAQIRRRSDGKRGLALCRAGTWIHVLGMDGASVGDALTPGYFDQLEAWRVVGKDHGPFGYEGEPAWPESDGDILVLERIEKEMILLYWRGESLYSQQVYRYVEP